MLHNNNSTRPLKKARFETEQQVLEWTDCVHFCFVSNVEDDAKKQWVSPTYLYFLSEVFQTAPSTAALPWTVHITFHATSLFAHVSTTIHSSSCTSTARYEAALEHLYAALPNGYTMEEQTFAQHCTDMKKPKKEEMKPTKEEPKLKEKPTTTKVHAYEVQDQHFEVHRSSLMDADMKEMFGRWQKLAPFFIEGADCIDVKETPERWMIYMLWKKGAIQYPVGYVSKYTFSNPLKDSIERICQVLILPLYQRQGHARQMVQCIMQEAMASPRVYQMTVEDPVPAFTAVRDGVDVEHCVAPQYYAMWSDIIVARDPIVPLKKEEMEKIRKEMKLTNGQLVKCFEALLWGEIQKTKHNTERERQYRLMVKRRLYAEMEPITHADRRKALLTQKYEAVVEYYQKLLVKANAVHP